MLTTKNQNLCCLIYVSHLYVSSFEGLNNGLVFNFGNDEFEKLKSLSYVVIFDDVINLFKIYNLFSYSFRIGLVDIFIDLNLVSINSLKLFFTKKKTTKRYH